MHSSLCHFSLAVHRSAARPPPTFYDSPGLIWPRQAEAESAAAAMLIDERSILSLAFTTASSLLRSNWRPESADRRSSLFFRAEFPEEMNGVIVFLFFCHEGTNEKRKRIRPLHHSRSPKERRCLTFARNSLSPLGRARARKLKSEPRPRPPSPSHSLNAPPHSYDRASK